MVLQGTEFECAWKAALGLKFSCCTHELEEGPKPKKRPHKKKGTLQRVDPNLQVVSQVDVNCSARVLRKLHTNRVLTCDPSDLL